MTEEPLLLFGHLIQTSIQSVLFYQRKIFIQQISHRALLKPLSMQPPFAARIIESIADQGLQNMLPASSLSTIGRLGNALDKCRPGALFVKALQRFAHLF